jgi:hypothetical protein
MSTSGLVDHYPFSGALGGSQQHRSKARKVRDPKKIKRKTSNKRLVWLVRFRDTERGGQTMFGRAILGVLCAIGLGAQASAAALIEETLRNGHIVLHLTGRIDSKDAALFAAAVGKLTAAGKRIDVVSPIPPADNWGRGR